MYDVAQCMRYVFLRSFDSQQHVRFASYNVYLIENTPILTLLTAILRCYGLHISYCVHLLRRCIRNRQVRGWYLRHGCPPTGLDRQE